MLWNGFLKCRKELIEDLPLILRDKTNGNCKRDDIDLLFLPLLLIDLINNVRFGFYIWKEGGIL
jgi:hypothetical protein